jgi:hypothetical protein
MNILHPIIEIGGTKKKTRPKRLRHLPSKQKFIESVEFFNHSIK